jgi:hypothetical protein
MKVKPLELCGSCGDKAVAYLLKHGRCNSGDIIKGCTKCTKEAKLVEIENALLRLIGV